jgi:hypothetical protein
LALRSPLLFFVFRLAPLSRQDILKHGDALACLRGILSGALDRCLQPLHPSTDFVQSGFGGHMGLFSRSRALLLGDQVDACLIALCFCNGKSGGDPTELCVKSIIFPLHPLRCGLLGHTVGFSDLKPSLEISPVRLKLPLTFLQTLPDPV